MSTVEDRGTTFKEEKKNQKLKEKLLNQMENFSDLIFKDFFSDQHLHFLSSGTTTIHNLLPALSTTNTITQPQKNLPRHIFPSLSFHTVFCCMYCKEPHYQHHYKLPPPHPISQHPNPQIYHHAHTYNP